MFARTARYSSRVYMSLPETISHGIMCKVSIISSGKSETECLHDKNGVPLFPIIAVRFSYSCSYLM